MSDATEIRSLLEHRAACSEFERISRGNICGHILICIARNAAVSWLIMTPKPQRRAHLISRTDAEAVLAPWTPLLRDTLKEAWDYVQTLLDGEPSARLSFDRATRASMVYDRFVVLLEQRLFGQQGVQVTRRGKMLLVLIGGRIRLRFKRLDGQLRSKNIPTAQQCGLYHQMTIPGLEDRATNVTFGYVTDVTDRKLRGVYFACPVSWSKNAWVIPIEDALSDAMPLLPVAPTPDLPLPTVKPKVAHRKMAE